jgi:hypothetical protein
MKAGSSHLDPIPYYIAVNQALNLGDKKTFNKLIKELIDKFPEDEWGYLYQSTIKHCYGLTDENLALLNKILYQNPQNIAAHDNRIMNSHYSSTISQEEILAPPR